MVQHVSDLFESAPPLWLYFPLGLLMLPWLIIGHYVGHAFAAVARTDGDVQLHLRTRRFHKTRRRGRLRLDAGPDGPEWMGACCRYDYAACSRWDLFLIALGGPAASLLGALLTYLLWQRVGGLPREVLYVATVMGAGVAFGSMLPLSLLENRKPDAKRVTLDGYQVIYALLGPPPPERGSRNVPPPGFPPVRAESPAAPSEPPS